MSSSQLNGTPLNIRTQQKQQNRKTEKHQTLEFLFQDINIVHFNVDSNSLFIRLL